MLNAGIGGSGGFLEDRVTTANLEKMLNVNVYQVAAMMNKSVTQLKTRGKKGKHSGIIVVSSITGELVVPDNYVYCGTKVFGKYLTMSTAMELQMSKSPIDIMALQPHYVRTKLIDSTVKKGKDFGTISVEDCV